MTCAARSPRRPMARCMSRTRPSRSPPLPTRSRCGAWATPSMAGVTRSIVMMPLRSTPLARASRCPATRSFSTRTGRPSPIPFRSMATSGMPTTPVIRTARRKPSPLSMASRSRLPIASPAPETTGLGWDDRGHQPLHPDRFAGIRLQPRHAAGRGRPLLRPVGGGACQRRLRERGWHQGHGRWRGQPGGVVRQVPRVRQGHRRSG